MSALMMPFSYVDDLDSVDDIEQYAPPSVICVMERKIGALRDDKAEFAVLVVCPTTGEISWDLFSGTTYSY